MFQNYHLRLSTFKNTRPGQEVSGWLYQTRSSSMMRTRKKRFVKLDGHQLIVFDSETGELKQNVYLSDGRIDRGEADRLLLVLTVKTKKLLLIAESDREFEKWFTAFQYVFKKLEHYYEPGNLIGRGAFSTVHRGRMRQRVDGDPLVAIKIVQNTSDHRFLNNNEIEILADVRHENIVKTYDVFESKEETYIVMEYMRGGQLYDVIAEAESFSERTSRGVLRNILLGIRYLHFRGIVHRDLKPENLLCTNRSINRSISPAVKIADFGLSAYLGPDRGEMLNTLVGSPGYVAPELLQQQPYSKPVDIWAVSGSPPTNKRRGTY